MVWKGLFCASLMLWRQKSRLFYFYSNWLWPYCGIFARNSIDKIKLYWCYSVELCRICFQNFIFYLFFQVHTYIEFNAPTIEFSKNMEYETENQFWFEIANVKCWRKGDWADTYISKRLQAMGDVIRCKIIGSLTLWQPWMLENFVKFYRHISTLKGEFKTHPPRTSC